MRKWEEDTLHFPQPQTAVTVCSRSSNMMRKPISISVFIETSSSQHQKGNVKALIQVPLKAPGLDHGVKITLTVGAPYLEKRLQMRTALTQHSFTGVFDAPLVVLTVVSVL